MCHCIFLTFACSVLRWYRNLSSQLTNDVQIHYKNFTLNYAKKIIAPYQMSCKDRLSSIIQIFIVIRLEDIAHTLKKKVFSFLVIYDNII